MVLLDVAITNFADMTNQFVFGWFGADFTLFAIIGLIVISGLAYLFRLPYHLSLSIAWVLVYMFDFIGITWLNFTNLFKSYIRFGNDPLCTSFKKQDA